jgi:hypothetical protein
MRKRPLLVVALVFYVGRACWKYPGIARRMRPTRNRRIQLIGMILSGRTSMSRVGESQFLECSLERRSGSCLLRRRLRTDVSGTGGDSVWQAAGVSGD